MSQSPKAGSQAASSLLCAPSYDFTPQSVFPTKCFISFSKYTYLTPQYIPYPSFIPWDSYCQQGQKKKHLIINSYLELITYHLPGKISCRGKSFTSSWLLAEHICNWCHFQWYYKWGGKAKGAHTKKIWEQYSFQTEWKSLLYYPFHSCWLKFTMKTASACRVIERILKIGQPFNTAWHMTRVAH